MKTECFLNDSKDCLFKIILLYCILFYFGCKLFSFDVLGTYIVSYFYF